MGGFGGRVWEGGYLFLEFSEGAAGFGFQAGEFGVDTGLDVEF